MNSNQRSVEIASVMRQALEALETTQTLMRLSDPQYVREYNAITSLRQAIARAEHLEAAVAEQHKKQEPVAWMHPDGRIWTFGRGFDKSTFTIPLYTHPQPRSNHD